MKTIAQWRLPVWLVLTAIVCGVGGAAAGLGALAYLIAFAVVGTVFFLCERTVRVLLRRAPDAATMQAHAAATVVRLKGAWAFVTQHRNVAMLALAVLGLVGYTAYPWTYKQCMRQAASMPTMQGVGAYKNAICDPIHTKPSAGRLVYDDEAAGGFDKRQPRDLFEEAGIAPPTKKPK